MKKWDRIIIVSLLVISFLPCICFKMMQGQNKGRVYAEVSVAGQLYQTIPLTGQKNPQKWRIETDLGYNEVVVKDEAIGIVEANCQDGLCEQFGFVKEPGKVIVCLPHKVYIEVKGEQDALDGRTY